MTPVLVVASHLPGETPFTSDRFEVRPVECVSIYDYGQGLADAWATTATIVNVEHDVECSDGIIQALIDCPHPLCAQTYPIYQAGQPTAYPYCPPVDPATWVTEGTEWAVWAAPGFIKARPEARINPLPVEQWELVEQATNRHVTGRWHLHWPPAEHHHKP